MEARLSKTAIRAPFSGTVGLRLVSVGEYLKEGQDIVNLESLDPLKVDFRVPELALSQVRDGQTLQLTLDALPDRVYDGRVYAINPLIDANGRAIVIRAQVPNKDGKLRPGMAGHATAASARAVIPDDKRRRAMTTIPSNGSYRRVVVYRTFSSLARYRRNYQSIINQWVVKTTSEEFSIWRSSRWTSRPV